MKCTNKEQETCEVEKRTCEGCYYNDKDIDLTTVYMSGFYDGEKKWKDKIYKKINELDNVKYAECIEKAQEDIELLEELLKG